MTSYGEDVELRPVQQRSVEVQTTERNHDSSPNNVEGQTKLNKLFDLPKIFAFSATYMASWEVASA